MIEMDKEKARKYLNSARMHLEVLRQGYVIQLRSGVDFDSVISGCRKEMQKTKDRIARLERIVL